MPRISSAAFFIRLSLPSYTGKNVMTGKALQKLALSVVEKTGAALSFAEGYNSADRQKSGEIV